MANVYAVKSGNWSDTTLWNTSALPTSADDVYANTFIVYINQDIDVLSLRTTAAAPIAAGGNFRLNHNIIARAKDVYPGSSTVITFLSASPFFSTFVGSVSGSTTNGLLGGIVNSSTGTLTLCGDFYSTPANIDRAYGAINSSSGIMNVYGRGIGIAGVNQPAGLQNASTGTLNVYGEILGSTSTANGYGCHTSGSGTTNIVGKIIGRVSIGLKNTNSSAVINITGDVVGGSAKGIWNEAAPSQLTIFGNISGGTGSTTYGLDQQGAGNVNVIGNVQGGSGSSAHGLFSQSTSFITISGSAIGGQGSGAYGAVNNSTGILRVKRAIGNDWGLGYTTALGAAPGVFGSQNGSTFVEELQPGPRGQWPTGGNIYFTPNSKAVSVFETDTFQNYSLIQSNSADNLLPAVSSVRQGTTYNLGLSTGTCVIPLISSVAAGALVDNLIGTAVLTPQTTWNYSVTASDINSMGGRLRNALNIDSAEKIIDSFA